MLDQRSRASNQHSPFPWEQTKECLSAFVIVPERNERPKMGEKEKQLLKSKIGYIIAA